MLIRIKAPETGGCGRLHKWISAVPIITVSNPINNYGVNINIGDYVHFGREIQERAWARYGLLCTLRTLRKKQKNSFRTRRNDESLWRLVRAYQHYEDSYKWSSPIFGHGAQSSISSNYLQNRYLGESMARAGDSNSTLSMYGPTQMNANSLSTWIKI
jgi:hypothetical protein